MSNKWELQNEIKKRSLNPYLTEIRKIKHLHESSLEFLIEFAETLVVKDLQKVKTHQIRRFFDSIKRLKNKVKSQNQFTSEHKASLLMLRPQLANASAKDDGLISLYEICTLMIGKINDNNKNDFYRFTDFFESIVAFHKVHGRD